MLEHDKVGPYWLVADAGHARRYLRSYAMDPRKNKLMSEQGIMRKAASIGDLGTKGGVVTDATPESCAVTARSSRACTLRAATPHR